jgi:hypothetical protein
MEAARNFMVEKIEMKNNPNERGQSGQTEQYALCSLR